MKPQNGPQGQSTGNKVPATSTLPPKKQKKDKDDCTIF